MSMAPDLPERPRPQGSAFAPHRAAAGGIPHASDAVRHRASPTGFADAPAAGSSSIAKLFSLTAALSVASTPTDVADAVVEQATAAFEATGTVIARVIDGGKQLEILRAGAMPEAILESWRRFSLDLPVPLADVARTGTALFLESRDDWVARYPDAISLLDATGHQSHIVAPLVVEGRAIGALGITFDRPRAFSDEDRTLALAIARQCALALDRARLFELERDARADAELARAAAEEARERADEANGAKTQFLTTMSHELRTPLNAIAGYAEILSMGIHGPVTAAQQEALERIVSNQRHLLGLINDVLNFARIEADRVLLDMQSVSTAAMFSDVEILVAPQIRAKAIRHSHRCDPSLTVWADPEKVRQILLNLVSNSVKFTPQGGEVVLDAEAAGATVAIRVRDSGIGIPNDQHEMVFQPFVQLGRDLTTLHGGTGLGLSISRDLARLMGGELSFVSVVGGGTVFTLELPAQAPAT